MLAEYRVAMPLVRYANGPPGVYRVLAQQPRGPVAEFPVWRREPPGRDAEYEYMSTFHWMPLMNGYSGMYPASYLNAIARLRSFPQRTAIDALRRAGIRYVIVHGSSYTPEWFEAMRLELVTKPQVVELGLFQDHEGPAALYILR
jgi:hypothetical protein